MLGGNAEKRGWLGRAARGPELGHTNECSDFLTRCWHWHWGKTELVQRAGKK